VEKVLDSGVPTLVQQYVTSVLINMQRDIQGVVKKAIQDAFPAAWLQEDEDEVVEENEEEDQEDDEDEKEEEDDEKEERRETRWRRTRKRTRTRW